LAKHGVGPETLGIEITETAMLQANDEVLAALHELSGIGVSICLDDFGTGYSSLALLNTLPIDNVKIDNSFIDGITSSPEGKAILKAVVAMCREMGLSTTAEGVEVEEQFSFLRDLGCDFAQGYLLGRPARAEGMTDFLSESGTLALRERSVKSALS